MQDKIEGTGFNSSSTASNCHSNDCAQSENVVRLNNLTSTGNYPSPKARKPYTISKQREKWTEEEHQKFLEALKLYGRGWRQIEEHIGTKTAVQIRSHAQKFFSKVARESNGSAESSIKPTDIPPPRPKRKPLHPYPRKSVDSCKGQSVSNETERSPSPNLLVAEKDTQSPTSVLSALNSEALGSAFSEQTKRCLSPNSCTPDIHSGSVSPVGKENDCMTSNSSDEELKESLAPVPAITDLNPDLLSMKIELNSKETTDCFKEDASDVPPVPSIKLFGRTVSMVDCQELVKVDEEYNKSITYKSDKENEVEDELGRAWPSKEIDTQLSLGMGNRRWEIMVDGAKLKSTEHMKENSCYVESTPGASLPWWNLCQGYLGPSKQIVNPQPIRTSLKERMEEKESSAGSIVISLCKMENRDKNSDGVDYQPRNEGVINPHKASRGFAPYKRCFSDRDSSSLIVGLEERKGQRARVCS